MAARHQVVVIFRVAAITVSIALVPNRPRPWAFRFELLASQQPDPDFEPDPDPDPIPSPFTAITLADLPKKTRRGHPHLR